MKSPTRNLASTARARRGAIRGMWLAILVIVGLALVLVLPAIGSYNALQGGKTDVEQKIAVLDGQFKRRADLIPNLVETVKGAANFEQKTLQNVVEARASVGRAPLPADVTDPAQMEAYMKAQSSLGGALSRLLVVAENYPQLRATQQFSELASEIAGTENRIQVARYDWTASVRDYNARLRKFPGNVVGGMFGFREMPQFAADESDRVVPKVDFGTQK